MDNFLADILATICVFGGLKLFGRGRSTNKPKPLTEEQIALLPPEEQKKVREDQDLNKRKGIFVLYFILHCIAYFIFSAIVSRQEFLVFFKYEPFLLPAFLFPPFIAFILIMCIGNHFWE